MKEILQESSLARDIRQIYTAVSTNRTAHVIINDFIDLSLQIPILGAHRSYEKNSPEDNFRSPSASSLMDIYAVAGYEYDNYPILCPYHTLLLLEDPEEVLKNMPLDASPTLVQLVQILTPTQSTRNIYVVSPSAKLDDMTSLESDFKQHIPNLSLPILLSKLQHTQQYHQVYRIKELKNQYLEAITWLIRKDLVVQVHMYLVLIQDSMSYQQQQASFENAEDVIASSPNNSDKLKRANHERAPKEVADLFDRLKPYMKGHNHIDEIIYREGISRRQLGLVLKYYRDKILVVYHC
ncbi:nitrogen permease regulator of amino acid transport activity 3-domain-containing protein [Sporodiniella umbellata]|nr:nitrogen permease regulator of amino acid transport activity 3-domain-containing protein [Sporodiniella umbellata]